MQFPKPFLQPVCFHKDFKVDVLRDDLIHPFLAGNKWRKLKYNLGDFLASGRKAIVTFGGPFSNHLVATAAAGKMFGIKTVGIVRGDKVENDYLGFMQKCGMELHFINRNDYRLKDDAVFVADFLSGLKNTLQPSDYFIIPEGGSNESAVKGVSEIINDLQEADFVACACGTGATLAGISRSLPPGTKAIGIPVLKARGYIEEQVRRYNGNTDNTLIFDDYHFGGYAKKPAALLDFCENFTSRNSIPIEPVYTGKLFYAIDDLIKKDYFATRSRIILVHTGGIFDFATPFPK